MNKLVIIGSGGLGREVAWIVERINNANQNKTWDLLGFLDDDSTLHGTKLNDIPVLGGTDWLLKQNSNDKIYAVCAIGSAKARKSVIEKLPDINFATIIDPDVTISDRVEIGTGCIIFPGTIITIDIKIGSHCVINESCIIGHDAELKEFVTLYPRVNISGNTVIGESVEMGSGSIIIQGLQVGTGTIVGAGAVVVRNLPEHCTAVGVPAKPIK